MALPIKTNEVAMDHRFEQRMDNWRRTVRDGMRGGSGSCCASWAALYVKGRLQDRGDIDPAPPRLSFTVDELDGWLIEAAVRSLVVFEEKQALRFWYVMQYPEHWIKSKLMLRRTGVRLVMARAENNLRLVLLNLDSPANILSNKLHAGIDPRPESTDAHVGASVTLEKVKALIE
jgi:hypothetical protein